jgi:predicted AlkP superfamily phosphohydrolase/phosphomutase
MVLKRVFVIGLDGATFDLLNPWVEEGKLPNLKKLMERSTYGCLESTIPPISPPAWTSFMTGVNPGKHGIFDFVTFKPNSFEKVLVNSSHIGSKRLWDLVGENGKKSIILYVPLTYPINKIEGVMISGIPVPPDGEFIYPKEMGKELEGKLGRWWMEIDGERFRDFREEKFLGEIYQTLESRFRVAHYLMTKEWDLFVLVFMETDLVQHFLWEEKERCILPLYMKIDEVIRHLMESLRGEDIVFILSDHGFGPIRKALYLNTWLKEKDFLVGKKQWLHSKETADTEIFHRKGSPSLVKRIKWTLSNKRRPVIDWSRTQAYFINTGQFHGIRINLKGREPEGIINPEEYDYVRDKIIAELNAMVDEEEERRVIECVFRREDIYWGHYVDRAPDIIFVPDYEYILSDRVRDHIFKRRRDGRGVHRREGILIIHGPNIKKGEKVDGAHIVDIAPSILYLLGIPIPKGFDGKVLKEIFEPHILDTYPIKFEDIPLELESNQFMMTEEEEEEIRKRLRGLGYIE